MPLVMGVVGVAQAASRRTTAAVANVRLERAMFIASILPDTV
jgi:hypothetical protein